MTDNQLKIRLKIDLPGNVRLGYGKVDLLRAVAAHQSISAAARSMGMSYRRAWMLIDELNKSFADPVIETHVGGKGHGGARLTEMGEKLIHLYDAACQKASDAVGDELHQIALGLVDTSPDENS
ncbi:winged helix-turn-helix domain-containing protein [Thalassospira sp. MA62]|nr:winged helix-turn-helix domain-containing protein [Thalassospira sp. MA62]